jgi:hypothetical protein
MAKKPIQNLFNTSFKPTYTAKNALEKLKQLSPGPIMQRLPFGAKQWIDALQQPTKGSWKRVVSLQMEAFWQNNSTKIILGSSLIASYITWKIYKGIAAVFIDVSSRSNMLRTIVASLATVALTVFWIHKRRMLDPDTVYRLAMLRLNTHAGLLEVLGPPLAGSRVRAFVTTGGRLRFPNGIIPKLASRRLQMIFPLRGSDRRGLVSVEAKKRKGKYDFKLLAVDVPSALGGEQRIFLVGGPSIYDAGGVLTELREPFVRALTLQESHDAEDDSEDRVEEKKDGIDGGRGGMWPHERLFLRLQRHLKRGVKVGKAGGE